MSVGALNTANDQMMMLMNILMQGMKQTADMSQQLVAMNVENSASGEKMAIAQNIIDVYA